MENFFENQLGKEYSIIKDDDARVIKVYRIINNEVDQETYVKFAANRNNLWDLAEGQRDKEFLLGEFEFEIGYCALYIAVHSILDTDSSKGNDDVKMRLRKTGDNLLEAQKVLGQHVKEKYFSFFQKVPGSIHLDGEHSPNYDVYYLSFTGEKVMIVNARKAPSIFVVLYNYAMKLQKFDEILGKWEEEINIDLTEREQLKRIYLRK